MSDSIIIITPSARYSGFCNNICVYREFGSSLLPTLCFFFLFFSGPTAIGSYISSDARLHVNPIHILVRRAVC